MGAPAGQPRPENIHRELDDGRVADQVVAAPISLEKPVYPLRVALAVRLEACFPESGLTFHLCCVEHWDAAARTQDIPEPIVLLELCCSE